MFFFFKQKTAYEIVSRDWSSDVCSSDLDLHCLYLSLCSLYYTWNYFIKSVYLNNNIYLNKLDSCIMEGVFYDDCNIGEEIGRASCRERV